jgi:hypothetical protein
MNVGTGLNGFGGRDNFTNIQVVNGSAFNDEIGSGIGSHTFNGAGGINTVEYATSPTGIQINFNSGTGINGNGETDNFANIQIVNGSQFDDTIYSGPGNHTFNGRGGFNTVNYTSATGAVTINLLSGSGLNGFGGADNFARIDSIIGSSHDDFIVSLANSVLAGGAGSDTFMFQRGQATGASVTDFTSGTDHLLFSGYGTSAAGAAFAQVDSTHWQINSSDAALHDIITFTNAAVIQSSDYTFV